MASKRIMSAAEIKAMLEAKAKGMEWPPANVIHDALNKNDKLVTQVAILEEEVEKNKARKYNPAQIRARLDDVLRVHGINAAFEPLVELAMERIPDTHPDPLMRGQFACSVDQRIKIWTELLSYQLPKLKAIEVAGQVDNSLTVIIRRFGDDAIIERPVRENGVGAAIDVPVKMVDVNPEVKVRKF